LQSIEAPLPPEQIVRSILEKKFSLTATDILLALDVWINANDFISERNLLKEIWITAFDIYP
jgi:hypothetical protein